MSYSTYKVDPQLKEAADKMLIDDRAMNCLDIQRGRLWDSICFAPGATITSHNSRFFSSVGIASGKTTIDSNLNSPQRLDPPESFLVERIILCFSSLSDPSDIRWVVESCVFQFWLYNRRYANSPIISLPRLGNNVAKAPLKTCLSCRSVSLDLKCKGCGSPEWKYLAYAGDGEPEDGDMDGVKFEIDLKGAPYVISNQMSFYGNLDMSYSLTLPMRGQKNFKLWTILEGWHARAIQ